MLCWDANYSAHWDGRHEIGLSREGNWFPRDEAQERDAAAIVPEIRELIPAASATPCSVRNLARTKSAAPRHLHGPVRVKQTNDAAQTIPLIDRVTGEVQDPRRPA